MTTDPGNDAAKVTDELREKIKSKMDVAKFFTGSFTVLIGILLKEGKTGSLWSKAGMLFLLSSLGFCVAAMFAYDHLLWPKTYLIENYWPNLKSKENPEECFHRKLEEQMLTSWRWLFLPAVACLGIGLFLLLVQESGLQPQGASLGVADKRLLLTLLVLAFGAPIALCIATWPRFIPKGERTMENDSAVKRGQDTYQRLFGEKSSDDQTGLRQFTIAHLFADIWSREEQLPMRDRSMITVALLAAQGRVDELRQHIAGALHQKITQGQILEIMIHVAHYAGWPAGHSGQRIALQVFEEQKLRDLNIKIGEAEKNGDVEFLESILAENLIFERANKNVVNKEEYLAALSSGARTYESLVTDQIKVGLDDDNAVVTLRVTTKGKLNGEEFSGQFTNVRRFVRLNGQWQCVEWRNTRIAQH